jgi:hypothetical protein
VRKYHHPKDCGLVLARRSEDSLSFLKGRVRGTMVASIMQFRTFLTKLSHLSALRRRKLDCLHSRVNRLHVAFVFAALSCCNIR